MSKSLSHLSDIATQVQNTAGITTSILEVEPDNGTLIKLLNRISTGSKEGLPIFMDLRDSNDNPLPADTTFILKAERPTDDDSSAVSVAEDNIAAWNGMSTSEQRNEENIDQVKIELKGPAVNIRYVDVLTFEVESSEVIDWSNSELYVAREGVEEHSHEA